MKKFLILLFFTCIFANQAAAVDGQPGNVELDFFPGEQNEEEITLIDQAKTILEVGRYFDKNYPENFIEGDLSDDVREFFPHLAPQDVYDREQTIRDGVKFYRYFRDVYNKVKEKMLVPEAPPLLVDDKDYDTGEKQPYIDAGEGQAVVITDIKKVLSYGGNIQDFKAYQAYLERKRRKKDDAPKNEFDKLSNMLQSLEWRKLPFYGLFYDNPVIGKKGIGSWTKDSEMPDLQASLLSNYTTVNDSSEIRGALEIRIPEGYDVPAFAGEGAVKPRISFGDSENLAQGVSFWPVPSRIRATADKDDRIVFRKSIIVPLLYKPEDIKSPLLVKATVNFTLCAPDGGCRPVELTPELKLEAGSGYSSAVSNLITQNFNYLPTAESKALTVDKIVADDEGHSLRIAMTTSGLVAKPDIFVSTGDNISFSRPRISVDGNRMVARLDILDKDVKLAGREVELTVLLNDYTALRSRYEVEAESLLGFVSDKLSLGMILLAVLGGFILNFMPCVFPVLSLKLLSVTRFGAQRETTVRKSFALTSAGIFGAFLFLALLLSALKAWGYSVGWGMQFQNPLFVIIILFVIALFLAQVKGFYQIRVPERLNRLLFRTDNQSNFIHLMTGILVVLMSTPCTGPYLGTVLGFALAGSTVDIFAILLSVALGVSLPYLLVLIMPDITSLVPKPGAWMNKLNAIMTTMLLLTMFWLLSVLWAQVGILACLRLAVYLSLFLVLMWFRHKVIEQVEIGDETPEIKKSVIRFIRIVSMLLSAVIFAISLWDVQRGFSHNRQLESETKTNQINLEEIGKEVRAGNIVVVSVGANWCLTCSYNNFVVFKNMSLANLMKQYNVKLIEVDWTNYSIEILNFMERFGRKGVPFYILFSPNIPEGMVLPEIMSEVEFRKIIKNIAG